MTRRGRRGEPWSPTLISTRVMRGGGRRAPQCGGRRSAVRTAAPGPYPQRSSADSSVYPPLSDPCCGPWHEGECRVGHLRGYFQVPSPWPGGWGAGAALTGPGCARNGAGDATRRGPGCAALQLSRRRRPRGPLPLSRPILALTTPSASAPRPPSRPHSPRAGREPPRGAEPPAPAHRLLPPSLQQVCTSAGTLLPALGRWAGSPSRCHPLYHSRGPFFGGGLPFVFVIGEVPGGAIRWGGGLVHKTLSIIFPVKARADTEERASVGVLRRRRKRDSVGFIWAGMCVFGKMDGSRCPRRDAAQCSSIAASPGFRWRGLARPLGACGPRPAPPRPRAALGRRLELLLPCHAASAGCGCRRTRSPRCEGVGVFFRGDPSCPAFWLCSSEGAPCSTNAGPRSQPADADGSLIFDRGTRALGRGCRRTGPSGVRRQWCIQGGSCSFSVYHP